MKSAVIRSDEAPRSSLIPDRGLVDVVDHEYVHQALFAFQFQAELLRDGLGQFSRGSRTLPRNGLGRSWRIRKNGRSPSDWESTG